MRVGIPFVWLGLLIGLSFIQNTVHAKVGGEDFIIDLMDGAGKMVFNSLNKMEIYMSIIFALTFIFAIPRAKVFWSFLIVVILLIVQSIRFLPNVDGYWLESFKMIIKGKSSFEFWYYLFEFIKSIFLVMIGFFAMKEIR
ncbi:hypothetical protein [Persicobacter sp. CCB-QB2]|nr:hypothetical protein [Persicobacter sp. CCB-QB2]